MATGLPEQLASGAKSTVSAAAEAAMTAKVAKLFEKLICVAVNARWNDYEKNNYIIKFCLNLNRKNKRHAIQMLLSKLNIYLKGLIKRRKNDEIAVYEQKIKVWNKFSIEY